MLRIVQNRSAAGAQSYYSKADYYSEGQELVGQWGGKGAAALGLSGEVGKREFDALCDNLHPGTLRRLTARQDTDRTVGYDFVFNAPKGVSLAYSLTRDERILDAFRTSIEETMSELEEEAKTRVRGKGRDEERTTGNLCWAEFVHFTARPVDGVPDPHLHAHCFTFNATFDADEERWKAGQFRDLKRDARYFEAAFHARFAERLQNLGYGVERRGKDWDLSHVKPEVTARYSRRTQLIEKMAEEKGISNPAAKSQLGAKSRQSKSEEHTLPELRELWKERLSADEQKAIATVPSAVAWSQGQSNDGQWADHAVAHCFERNSVVAVKDLLQEAFRRGVGQVNVNGVKRAMAARDLIEGDYRGRKLATTREVLSEEKSLIRYAKAGRGTAAALNGNWKIQRQWLNQDQQDAVRRVLTSTDAVQIVRGRAGTGKTSLMQEAVAGIEAGGHRVFTFAPSAEASRGVLSREGFAGATTVSELLVNQQLQRDSAGHVVWIDEAGLLGTRTLKKVFDLAQQLDCRVVLSGDWTQHGSVERGAALRLLEQEAGLRPASVRQNLRQEPLEYRAIVDMIAEGQIAPAIDRADQLGWVRELDDGHRNMVIAHDYVAAVRGGESVLVVCPTHSEGERVSRAIRSELKEQGQLGCKDESLLRLIPLHLTEAERRDSASYSAGDVIVFHQNATGYPKGTRLTLTEQPSEALLRQASHFQVYHATEMPVATHELLRITANGTTKDGHRLNNGSHYRVAGITAEGDVKLDNGWTVSRDFGMWAPGYVSTSHSSQGKTVDRVLIAEPSAAFGAASAEQLYVSASRGRKGMRIYVDDKEAFKVAVHRSSDRVSASSLLEGGTQNGELRRLHAARQELIRRQETAARVPERRWEMVYGR
ncbi:MobF family relaxase [Anatilimnocola floriformis]|uniref:MobF family relaxase n=1 Tax=Anatilimnocola floriformis TaxID=2948575 RepID=UPI0020C2479D|nr:MobF family relaxase [Anatilimnocola floriformis]